MLRNPRITQLRREQETFGSGSKRAAGASRAIEIAKRGETWASFDLHAEALAMCIDELAARSSNR
jgi:hypothetical protein